MSSPPSSARSIVLIGLMGCGKSTVGRELSRYTGLPLLDTDAIIEEQTGMGIPRIFAEQGERHFRALETALLTYLRDNATTRPPSVIATGGGIILRPQNRAILRTLGLVVWLDVDLPNLLIRTTRSQCRPLLQGCDREDRIRSLLAARSPLYAETAHLRVNSSHMKATEAVDEIIRRIDELRSEKTKRSESFYCGETES